MVVGILAFVGLLWRVAHLQKQLVTSRVSISGPVKDHFNSLILIFNFVDHYLTYDHQNFFQQSLKAGEMLSQELRARLIEQSSELFEKILLRQVRQRSDVLGVVLDVQKDEYLIEVKSFIQDVSGMHHLKSWWRLGFRFVSNLRSFGGQFEIDRLEPLEKIPDLVENYPILVKDGYFSELVLPCTIALTEKINLSSILVDTPVSNKIRFLAETPFQDSDARLKVSCEDGSVYDFILFPSDRYHTLFRNLAAERVSDLEWALQSDSEPKIKKFTNQAQKFKRSGISPESSAKVGSPEVDRKKIFYRRLLQRHFRLMLEEPAPRAPKPAN